MRLYLPCSFWWGKCVPEFFGPIFSKKFLMYQLFVFVSILPVDFPLFFLKKNFFSMILHSSNFLKPYSSTIFGSCVLRFFAALFQPIKNLFRDFYFFRKFLEKFDFQITFRFLSFLILNFCYTLFTFCSICSGVIFFSCNF